MIVRTCALIAVGLFTAAAAPAVAAGPQPCATQRTATTAAEKPTATSADTTQVMAAIDAMGGVERAAPNAEAQAALDAITSLMAGRADPDSQAAAAMMRKYASAPGPMRTAPKKPARPARGC